MQFFVVPTNTDLSSATLGPQIADLTVPLSSGIYETQSEFEYGIRQGRKQI
jgi:hypothetical protein